MFRHLLTFGISAYGTQKIISTLLKKNIMNYYHDIITEKSWQKLQKLRRLYNFILIGGWAVYIYTKALKSKDIDFICDYETLQKLKESYDLVKNDRLKNTKYMPAESGHSSQLISFRSALADDLFLFEFFDLFGNRLKFSFFSLEN